jgi:hypothetical protein
MRGSICSCRQTAEIQRIELLQHIADAGSNLVALVAQRCHFGARAFGFGDPRTKRLELARQSRIVLGRPRLFALQPADHVHEHFDFLFESIDRLDCGRCRLGCCGHAEEPFCDR